MQWNWNPEGERTIHADTSKGRYTVERVRRRKPKFVTRFNEALIAIRGTENEAIIAAKEHYCEIGGGQ